MMAGQGSFYQRDRAWHPPAFTPQYKSTLLRAPRQALVSLEASWSETTGPRFGHGLIGPLDNDLILNWRQTGEPIGQRMVLHGRVLDENARPVPGALVELWQANAGGRYRHDKETYRAAIDPNFGGCGRTITDADGQYWFRTIKPGAYPWPNGVNDWRPAHIHLSLFGHAFAQRLITQLYFEGDPMIRQCPIATTIMNAEALDQLTALLDRQATTPHDALAYKFDIVLRGRRSTPFENRPEGN